MPPRMLSQRVFNVRLDSRVELGGAPDVIGNIRLGWGCFRATNTLAYYNYPD
jgi:hypothetical protein